VIRKILRGLLPGKKPRECGGGAAGAKPFRRRYARFRNLLDANAALGELMADMARKLEGRSLFGDLYLQNTAGKALELARRMVNSLQGMSGGRRDALNPALERIAEKLAPFLPGKEGGTPDGNLPPTLNITRVDAGMADLVGGKCANLGELRSRAGVPVPRGFAVTLHAFRLFMAHEGLAARISRLFAAVGPEKRGEFAAALKEAQKRVMAAPLPPALLSAFEEALEECFGGEPVRLAVRSSARSEDGDKSFAGQFPTELGVRRDDLPQSYKRVIAGLFTPSAVMYRLHHGIPLSESGMAAVCMEMVDAVAGGVAYSHDPLNLLSESVIISGVWGLGRYLVDGVVSPDTWVFTRESPHELIRRRAGKKEHKLVLGPDGGIEDREVPPDEQRKMCLSDERARLLASVVMRLEAHYGTFRDVEWAVDREGKPILLQCRPLSIRGGAAVPRTPLLDNYPLLLEGGESAYPGIGCGPVVRPASADDLPAFPEGGVLVAAHSGAEYAQVLDRAQAVVTRIGSVTGHMATICREFRVPTLLNVPDAMQVLKAGMVVTVDAFSCRIYEGEAAELLPMRMRLDSVSLRDTPVHARLREAAALILPLNLTDPQAASFTPSACATLHDIMRYVHECSYHEMFAISDSASDVAGGALKFNAPLPVDLYVIDLEGGVSVEPGATSVGPEQILSAPMRALLRGMLRPDTVLRRPRPVNVGGFLSVMGQQMINPRSGDERFGEKSYAVISDRYMNFSSRVGYHYSVLDAYCGNTTSKNYITFMFQGGAAGEERRVRRCRAIALVLEELGFVVRLRGDSLQSRFAKYEKAAIEERLDQLGRLLQVTRQLDMLMTDDDAVTRFKEDFMSGVYR
jgi:pyruvate,water dikinase